MVKGLTKPKLRSQLKQKQLTKQFPKKWSNIQKAQT